MDFTVKKGEKFSEDFNFKTATGQSIALPAGDYKLIVRHDSFVREYTIGKGLTKSRTKLVWSLTPAETKDFAYSTMYYTLYMNETELARGILRVQ